LTQGNLLFVVRPIDSGGQYESVRLGVLHLNRVAASFGHGRLSRGRPQASTHQITPARTRSSDTLLTRTGCAPPTSVISLQPRASSLTRSELRATHGPARAAIRIAC